MPRAPQHRGIAPSGAADELSKSIGRRAIRVRTRHPSNISFPGGFPVESVICLSIAVAILVSHAPFLLSFVRSLRRQEIPDVLRFATLGIFVYYDLGFALEALGWHYPSPFFAPILSYSLEEFATIGIVILVAPYLLALGFRPTASPLARVPLRPVLGFAPRMKPIFLLLFLPVVLALGFVGFTAIRGAASAAEVKLLWMGTLGSGYIVFLLPLFLVSFFLRTADCSSRSGYAVLAILLVTSVAATLFLGQRTMTLLPFLMLVFFHIRLNAFRLAVSVVALFAFASAALFFYKGYAIDNSLDLAARAEMVFGNDLTRAPVLARAVRESQPLGTVVLPTAGQGYWYAAQFYLPRSLAPAKGYSTPAYFTALTNGEDAEYISWSLGLGFLEELILNFGFYAVFPGVVLYGLGLGLLQRAARAWPCAAVGIHLAAFWMCGYALPSVLLYFGTMTMLAILLQSLFIQTAQDRSRHRRTRLQPLLDRREVEPRLPLSLSQPFTR
jgi:hypothetical protein